MSPPPWANPAQLEFLNKRKQDFKAAQKEKKLATFWTDLHRDFFAQWDSPESEVVTEEDAPKKRKRSHVPKEEGFPTVETWIADRKQKLNNWFNNHGIGKKSRTKAPVIQLGSHLSDQPKRLQTEIHIYSKKYFAERVKPGVDAECLEKGIDEHGRIAVVNRHLAERYQNESEETKEEIQKLRREQETAKEAAREAAIADVKQDRSPEEYLNAIDFLPEVFEEFCKHVDKTAGWAITIIAGGPDPMDGGKIRTIGYHSHKNKYGLSFGKASTSFQDSYLKPFSAFLHTVYSADDMKKRALGYVGEKQEESPETPKITWSETPSTAPDTPASTSTGTGPAKSTPSAPNKRPQSQPDVENIPVTTPKPAPTSTMTAMEKSDTVGALEGILPTPGSPPTTNRVPVLTPHVQNISLTQTQAMPALVDQTLPSIPDAPIAPLQSAFTGLDLFGDTEPLVTDTSPTNTLSIAFADTSMLSTDPLSTPSVDGLNNVLDGMNAFSGPFWQTLGKMSDEEFRQLCNSNNFPDQSDLSFGHTSAPTLFDPLATPLWQQAQGSNMIPGINTLPTPATTETLNSPPSSVQQAPQLPSIPPCEAQFVKQPVASPKAPIAQDALGQDDSRVEPEERAIRNRKPTGSKEVVALTAQQTQLPEWLKVAKQYLVDGIEDEAWQACLEAWMSFEKENLLLSTAHRLPTAKLRPDELSKWLSSRKYQSVPAIPNLILFADQWCRWWNSLQPSSRQKDGPCIPAPLSTLGENPNVSAIKRGGPNGLLTVLIGLKWWAGAHCEDGRWLAAMNDIRDCFECFGKMGTKRKATGDDGCVSKKKKT